MQIELESEKESKYTLRRRRRHRNRTQFLLQGTRPCVCSSETVATWPGHETARCTLRTVKSGCAWRTNSRAAEHFSRVQACESLRATFSRYLKTERMQCKWLKTRPRRRERGFREYAANMTRVKRAARLVDATQAPKENTLTFPAEIRVARRESSTACYPLLTFSAELWASSFRSESRASTVWRSAPTRDCRSWRSLRAKSKSWLRARVGISTEKMDNRESR